MARRYSKAWRGTTDRLPASGPFARLSPKYKNKKTEIDGIVFASRKEAMRYISLRAQESEGSIRSLQYQVRMPIEVNGEHICDYIADFVYERREEFEDPQHGHAMLGDWQRVVEDVKGYRKGQAYQIFRLKAKLLQATAGVHVQEF